MKKIFLTLSILFLPLISNAQQTINIPPTPGVISVGPTIPGQSIIIDTCTYSPTTGTITINGVAVTSLTLSSLTLDGGIAYKNGTYLTQITNGIATLTPYVAPPTPSNPIIYQTVAITSSASNIVSYGNRPAGFTIPAGITKIWIANVQGPYVGNLAFPWDFGWIILTPATSTTTGTGTVYAKNVSLTAYQFTGATVTLGMSQ